MSGVIARLGPGLRALLCAAALPLAAASAVSLGGAPAAAQEDPNMFEPGRMQCREPRAGADRVQIAGGTDAQVRDYPFIVQVRVGNGVCGGSLFARGFVLTAAHCVMPPPGSRDCVPAEGSGRCELAPASAITIARPDPSGEPRGETRGVTALRAHPNFRYPVRGGDPGALDADIAILRLDQPYDLAANEYVRLAAPRFDQAFTQGGECARVAGWGLTDVLDSQLRVVSAGTRTAKLQTLNLGLLDRDRCAARYPGQITDNMLCAGDGVQGYNTCKGDSGGPLVLDVGESVQVGVVSWAYGCAQEEHYTIFTRVGSPEVRGWINDVMAGRQ